MREETIRIKYHSNQIEKLTYIEGKSDWIDLRVAEDVTLKAGEFRLISMGVSMQLPRVTRCSLFQEALHLKTLG